MIERVVFWVFDFVRDVVKVAVLTPAWWALICVYAALTYVLPFGLVWVAAQIAGKDRELWGVLVALPPALVWHERMDNFFHKHFFGNC